MQMISFLLGFKILITCFIFTSSCFVQEQQTLRRGGFNRIKNEHTLYSDTSYIEETFFTSDEVKKLFSSYDIVLQRKIVPETVRVISKLETMDKLYHPRKLQGTNMVSHYSGFHRSNFLNYTFPSTGTIIGKYKYYDSLYYQSA